MPLDAPSSLPRVQFGDFEGPLDLLLDEVRRQNIDIEELAMAPIVSRFLDYVATASTRSLNLDIDWLHMAAVLIHWKSLSLLPQSPGVITEPDRIRETLVQQLMAHRRQAAEALNRQRTAEEHRFSKAEIVAAEEDPGQAGEPSILSVWDLVQQARELAGWVVKHREERRQRQEFHVELDDVTVSEMSDYLRAQIPLWHDGGMDGTKLRSDEQSPSRRACLFLGMLELAQQQVIEVQQSESFGELWLRRR